MSKPRRIEVYCDGPAAGHPVKYPEPVALVFEAPLEPGGVWRPVRARGGAPYRPVFLVGDEPYRAGADRGKPVREKVRLRCRSRDCRGHVEARGEKLDALLTRMAAAGEERLAFSTIAKGLHLGTP